MLTSEHGLMTSEDFPDNAERGQWHHPMPLVLDADLKPGAVALTLAPGKKDKEHHKTPSLTSSSC